MTTPEDGERKYIVRKGVKFCASVRATSPGEAIGKYVASLRNLGYQANPADFTARAG